MQYEILHQDHLVWVYYCACGVCFLFFLLGRNHKSICSGEALRSEKMQPGMRSWWWTNGWKECRCVIVFGASRHQLAWLCLVGKKPLPGEQPVADLQLEVTVVGFWWEYPLHNLQRDFVDQSLAKRSWPSHLSRLPPMMRLKIYQMQPVQPWRICPLWFVAWVASRHTSVTDILLSVQL